MASRHGARPLPVGEEGRVEGQGHVCMLFAYYYVHGCTIQPAVNPGLTTCQFRLELGAGGGLVGYGVRRRELLHGRPQADILT